MNIIYNFKFCVAGLDWGGVRREWFEVISHQLFDGSESGLFTRFLDDSQALVR